MAAVLASGASLAGGVMEARAGRRAGARLDARARAAAGLRFDFRVRDTSEFSENIATC
jgi:hypothetical protein